MLPFTQVHANKRAAPESAENTSKRPKIEQPNIARGPAAIVPNAIQQSRLLVLPGGKYTDAAEYRASANRFTELRNRVYSFCVDDPPVKTSFDHLFNYGDTSRRSVFVWHNTSPSFKDNVYVRGDPFYGRNDPRTFRDFTPHQPQFFGLTQASRQLHKEFRPLHMANMTNLDINV